jgi:hypothetical protein
VLNNFRINEPYRFNRCSNNISLFLPPPPSLPLFQVSVPDQQSSTVEDNSPLTFEDRRKMNFEAGRRELQRRKEELRKQQEKEIVSYDRLNVTIKISCPPPPFFLVLKAWHPKWLCLLLG